MEKSKLKFVCISDTHTKTYGLNLPPGDILIHAGDFTSTGLPAEVSNFNEFLKMQPFKYKIVIAGNHDLTFDTLNYENSLKRRFHSYYKQEKEIKSEEIKKLLTNCIYLEDQSIEIEGYKFYGSPWSPYFYGWGFNLNRGKEILEKWKAIPSDTDILITHGPPYGILDQTYDGVNVGCEDLKKEIFERIKPKVHIFGHIHEAYGEKDESGIKFINASTCTLSYRPNNKPIVFELPIKEINSKNEL